MASFFSKLFGLGSTPQMPQKDLSKPIYVGTAQDIIQQHWDAYQRNPQGGVSTGYRPEYEANGSWQLLSGNGSYQLTFVVYLVDNPIGRQLFQQHRYYPLFTAYNDGTYDVELKTLDSHSVDIFTTILVDIFNHKGNQVPVHEIAIEW